MQTTLLVFHNWLRWAVLLFGLFTVLNALTGTLRRRPFTESDNKSNLLFMITCDLQLLFGLLLYFTNGWFDKLKHFSEYKTDASLRFFIMEHEAMMLLAWILVHIGRSAVKKTNTDQAKHKRMLVFFGIAFILILVAIPWHRPFLEWFS